ncbi:MAG: uracil-DNA glycosylase [Neisseriaceae bacterium]|nr:uracil-DNA glycosylase [Neisseriaceae bacterium]
MKSWADAIGREKQQPYFQKIIQQVNTERQSGQIIYPPARDVFNAFRYTEFNRVKVVIIGQDPYHNENQAHGLAFSVQMGVEIPPSLKNIYKELASDIDGFQIPNHGCLKKWADEGVMLLNTVLTVKAHLAHSHKDIGWETFTDKVIEVLNQHRENLVFLLWGNPAQKKGSKIDTARHLVLKAAHPSPLSAHRGFFGCRHFSQTNQYLKDKGISPIDWQV